MMRFVNRSLGKSEINKNKIKQTYETFSKVVTNDSSLKLTNQWHFQWTEYHCFKEVLLKTNKKISSYSPSLVNTLSNTFRTTEISTLQDMLSSFQMIPYTEKNKLETGTETETLINETLLQRLVFM